MDEHATSPERRCPACGAALLPVARFCGACGVETLPDKPDEVNQPAAQETPQQAESGARSASQEEATEATEIAEGRLCLWCGARSPLEAARCVSCGATFPTPEGDEALERAARARIQAMENDLKQPRSGWWPFRAR